MLRPGIVGVRGSKVFQITVMHGKYQAGVKPTQTVFQRYVHIVTDIECHSVTVRPFLMQSDLSVENVLFRLKPKSGFLTQSKRAFSTQLFSTENSDWRIQ